MSLLQRHIEDRKRFSRIKRGFILLLAAIAAAETLLPLAFESEHHFAFEGFPAFGSLYGFLSCALIIVLSKIIGKAWLMRGEDYYDS